MEKWKPFNYRGGWSHDPRGELKARARNAQESHDDWVAIPVKLAIACADLRECKATMIIKGDHDGPFKEPLTIVCHKPEKHEQDHFNGSLSWK